MVWMAKKSFKGEAAALPVFFVDYVKDWTSLLKKTA